VNADLKGLVRLQENMLACEALADRIGAVPAEVARLEKDLLEAEAAVEKGRAALQEMQKDRRHLEMELMGVESKISKYQTQLLEVKTNKEYQAMLKEIDTCRAERAALDEKILLEMEEAEKRALALRAMGDGLDGKRKATAEGKARLDALVRDLGREKEILETERKDLSAGIGAAYLDPFLKVARQRKGLALVAVREGLCGGCHVRVMPTLVQQVRRATGLIACDSCKRFLYVLDEASGGSAPIVESPAR
jgi:uncharacterized protein